MSISVIIPCYRAAATLRRAVDSALTGAPADLEVLLVDDGSSDDTGALCDELAAADPREPVQGVLRIKPEVLRRCLHGG